MPPLRRFYCPDFESKITDRELLHRIAIVMRAKIGERMTFFDGQGWEYYCEILAVDRKALNLRLIEKTNSIASPSPKVTIAQALTKPPHKFESVLQKATELGASAFVPLVTTHTTGIYSKKDRLEKIITEACEQCGRGDVPDLSAPVDFAKALDILPKPIVLLDPRAKTPLRKILPKLKKAAELSILIGPERGFSEDEIVMATTHRAEVVSLGELILRTETVAPSLLATIFWS